MKHLGYFILSFILFATEINAQIPKTVKITAEPENAAIYINNTFMGYGFAEFTRPKKREVAIIKIECSEYNTLNTKFYGEDKRSSISYKLQQDGFYRASAASGIVNKFITVQVDSLYFQKTKEGKIVLDDAWKMIHQILLNYFDEIETTDYHGGYIQTVWQYKTFNTANKQIRNRVTIRDISNPSKAAIQIKISSEVAGANAARHGEFVETDRIPKEFETVIQELQTRIGKVSSL